MMTQNFSSKNLRGRSFRGQNLQNANFRYADIRGTDFTDANLTGADFSFSKSGIKTEWAIILLGILLILSGLSGYFSGLGSYFILTAFSGDISNLILLLVLAGFIWIGILRGLWTIVIVEFVAGILALTSIWIIKFVLNIAIVITGDISQNGFFYHKVLEWINFLLLVWKTIFAAIYLSETLFWVLILSIFALAAKIIADSLGKNLLIACFCLPYLMFTNRVLEDRPLFFGIIFVLQVIFIGLISSSKNKTLTFIHFFAVQLTSFNFNTISSATNFNGANLKSAIFTKAIVKNANFYRANLTLTCWYQAKGMEYAKLDNTILNNSKVRNLIITKKGRGGNLAGLNLQGANLNNADLRGANLSHTNLYRASLRGADLRDAKLFGTNFYKVKGLDSAKLDGTILDNSKVRDLVITKKGRGKKFTGLNFQGANLDNADLRESDLSQTNLYGAFLRGADLRKAQLVRANLKKADLSRAKLSGANLKKADWYEAKLDLVELVKTNSKQKKSSTLI